MNFKKLVFATVLLVCGSLAQAQVRTYLDKGEVEQMFVGKVTTFLRLEGSYKVKWDIRPGGMLYANNITSGQSDVAKWEVNGDGGICVKWRGRSTDGCFFTFKSGDKLMRTSSKEPDAPILGEILEVN